LLPFEQPAQRTISGPWEFLLMEAARVRDESAQAADADPAAGASPDAGAYTHVTVVETLISSDAGDVLYEWQCPDAGTRLAWLQTVAHAAAEMASESPLGAFDRLEINAGFGRAVAQARADRLIFVRVTHQPEPHE
jgi:hypothetical protein